MTQPDPHLLQELHGRLLEGDLTAPAELAELVLEPLTTRLRAGFPYIPDPVMIDDAVVDSVLSYAERPGQFDPAKRGLLGYLQMSAEGDLKNALQARGRRQRRERSLDLVELHLDRRNRVSMASEPSSTPEEEVVSQLAGRRLMAQARAAAETPEDASVLELMIAGERRTDRFAEALGLAGLSPDQRRREVKRHKDRLRKRIERLRLTKDV